MKTIRSGAAVYLVRAAGDGPVSVRRQGAGVLARTIAVAALAVGAALGLAAGEAPAIGDPETVVREAAAAPVAKDDARLAAWTARGPAPVLTLVPSPALPAAETAPIFAPRLAAAPAQARFAKIDPAVTGSLMPGAFEPPAPRSGEWREEEFAQVRALDGRTLAAPAVVVRLSGLELPESGEVCRTLDGRLEPCAVRAATQLELMTRHRKVACRYRIEARGEAVGTCRVGTSDLAERMLRTGFARRAPGTERVAMAPALSSAN
ncbi:MAG TPA: hypothetical protein VF744_03370 [Beijerinckiaceae bacterium]|jgi:endonuclease YncB( thermonuclease family)